MVTTKIKIKPHLAEYVIGKWSLNFMEPVTFPSNSEIYFLIHDLIIKRPLDYQTDFGNLEIVIPNRRADDEHRIRKNPDVYNYISERSCKVIEKRIESLFWAELHEELDHNKHRHGIEFIDTVNSFRSKYHIESISDDALLKNFQRWREKVRQKEKRAYRTKK